jgi:hypothetical protein
MSPGHSTGQRDDRAAGGTESRSTHGGCLRQSVSQTGRDVSQTGRDESDCQTRWDLSQPVRLLGLIELLVLLVLFKVVRAIKLIKVTILVYEIL